MSFTNCCNHRFIGDNHSPIQPDGYCLHCGFHPEIEALKEANKVLREAVEFYGDPEMWMIKDKHSWRKSSPKSHGDDEMIINYQHPRRDWVGTIIVGGKLARKAIAKANEIIGEKK